MHTHRETSDLSNDIPEESGPFRFLRAVCLSNIKGSVGLILVKASVMRISIRCDLSSRSFIPLPRFIRSRRPTTLLAPSLVFSPLSKDAAPHVRLCGKFTAQPHVRRTCGKRAVGIFFPVFFLTDRRLENRSVGQKNAGFNEERVLSVCTGSADKI